MQIRPATANRIHLLRIDVDAQHPVPGPGKLQRKRQTDIAQADDGNGRRCQVSGVRCQGCVLDFSHKVTRKCAKRNLRTEDSRVNRVRTGNFNATF